MQLADLQFAIGIALDYASLVRKVHRRPLIRAERRAFAWIVFAVEDADIERQAGLLGNVDAARFFRLVERLYLELDPDELLTGRKADRRRDLKLVGG